MGKVTEKYEENKTQDEIHTVQCAECKRETRHKVIQSLDYSGSEVFNGGQQITALVFYSVAFRKNQ